MKERYTYLVGTNLIHDVEDNYLYSFNNLDELIKTLNKQDKRIKDLENMNSRLSQGIYWGNGEHFCDVVSRLKQENQQLKEENGYIVFCDGYDENGNEIHKQEFVKCKDRFKELLKENKQLKQSQKQLAIAELEKVKIKFNGKRPIDELASEVGLELSYTATQINNFIENQIKELRS